MIQLNEYNTDPYFLQFLESNTKRFVWLFPCFVRAVNLKLFLFWFAFLQNNLMVANVTKLANQHCCTLELWRKLLSVSYLFSSKSAKSKYWLILSQPTVEQWGLKPLTGVPHSGWGMSLRSKSNKYWKPPLGHIDLISRIQFGNCIDFQVFDTQKITININCLIHNSLKNA